MINNEINNILDKVERYSKMNNNLVTFTLKNYEVNLLYKYIKDQEEKIKQLRTLAISLDKELTNMTKEVEVINL